VCHWPMMHQRKPAVSFATRLPRHQRGRVTGFGAVAAVVLLTLAAALIFSHFPSHAKPSVAVKPTATAIATATSVPLKTWSPVPHLTFTGTPTMATSDAQVIYEVVRGTATLLRRTTDGGASWQAVPLPFHVVNGIPLNATLVTSPATPGTTTSISLDANRAVLSGYPHILQFLVSPLNPQVVWLQTNYRALLPPKCLALVPGLASTQPSSARPVTTLAVQLPVTPLSGTINPPCIVQFFSTDGGQQWTPTAATTVFPVEHVDPPAIWVQGQRLYARAYVNALSAPATATYLMTSLDGGTTWTTASASIGDPNCDTRPAPTGSTVFAITGTAHDCYSGAKVWRSDDAGTYWRLVSQLDLTEEQLYVAGGSDQSTSVVYLFAATTGPDGTNATTLLVSLDGGKNWTPAPTPTTQSNLLGTSQGYTALTSDGRVIAAFSADASVNDATLYSWKVGDPRWSPIGPAPQTAATAWAVYFLATPSLAGGPDALWYVTNPSDLTMEFYRLQL
jgi:hypothetical protein